MLEADDGPAALRSFCLVGGHNVERAAPLFGALRAASSDPEVAEVLATNKRLRVEGYSSVDPPRWRAGTASQRTSRWPTPW